MPVSFPRRGVLKKSYILLEYLSVFYSGDTRPPSTRIYKVIAKRWGLSPSLLFVIEGFSTRP